MIAVGVDTHKDSHYAVALDHIGQMLAELMFSATAAGYAELQSWAEQLALDPELVFGIERAPAAGVLAYASTFNTPDTRSSRLSAPAAATGELESPTASTHSQPPSECSEVRTSQPRAVAGS